MTQFQQSILATENGTMQVPTVHTEGGSTIPFAGYQLATSRLRLWVRECLKSLPKNDVPL